MNEMIKNKLIKARINLLTSQPFYGTLALRLQLLEMPDALRAMFASRGLPATLAVDGKRIFYAPEFIESLSLELVQSAIAHEIGHCIWEHINRRGSRDPEKWNAAGDYVINPSLKDAGFPLGDGWLYDPQYAGMTADQVYRMLPDRPKGGQGKNPKGGGPAPWGNPLCDILDAESKKDPLMQDEWKIAVTQAAAAAQQAGKLPADMKRFVEEMNNPKTDWRTELRRFVTEIAKDDYSWVRPNKKMLGAHGFYLPSLYSEQIGHIVIAIDTSGSITQPMLNIFGSEIDSIRTAVKPQMTTVIYCDAEVNHVDEFTAEDVLELNMHGGGGTSFVPPFKYVEEHGINPRAFMYMTDGYGSAPSHPPEYPVLWCMTTDVRLPWGEHIDLDLSDDKD
jgi:predicted metal-dependent peptidase